MRKQTTGSKTTKRESSSRSVPKLEVDRNSNINVSKIENGFLISESGTTGKGRNMQYYNKQYYSPTNPVEGITGKVKFGKK